MKNYSTYSLGEAICIKLYPESLHFYRRQLFFCANLKQKQISEPKLIVNTLTDEKIMVNEQEKEVKKKWAIHCAQVEQTKLINCLSSILDTIKNAPLEKTTKHALSTFYNELKNYYAGQSIDDLVNNSRALQEYSGTYLENHNMLLLVGVLTQEKIIPYEVSLAVKTLQHVPSQLREQGTTLINALQAIEPYAIKINRKLDEDFYADEERSPSNKLR
ncbi:hypothetical protein [Legionella sp. km772]|uniref:hypothetical protein n=1 Tax=Legionella sp. km772 TaxID=2498111 RepID=UPI000F8E5DC0|nr:hypothetical protein [Legionella sp. km772]RUR12302.1 hypothetical protein ELY15_05525 [Legionella sp. km772]